MALDLTSACTLYHNNPILAEPLNYLLIRKELAVTHKPTSPADFPQTEPVFCHNNFHLFGTEIILNYLEEIFPEPPLLPGPPAERALHRMIIEQILTEWYPLDNNYLLIRKANDSIDALKRTQFFLSPTVAAIDCFLYPIMKRIATQPGPHPRIRQYTKDLTQAFTPKDPFEIFDMIGIFSLL